MQKRKLLGLILAGLTMVQAVPMWAKVEPPKHDWITTSWEEPGNWKHLSVDGNSGTRWTTNNKGNWIKYDLGIPKKLDRIGIELFYPASATSRKYTYTIQTSVDGKKWKNICNRVVSGGINEGMVYYDLNPDEAIKYVKIIGYGNTESSWFSVAEVDFDLDTSQVTEEEKKGELRLAAPESVREGKEIKVIVTGTNAKRAYAQDIKVTYDDEAFELVSIEGLDETQVVEYSMEQPGELRILSATDGGLGIIDDIYALTLRAKKVPVNQTYVIAAVDGRIGKVKDALSEIIEMSSAKTEVLVVKDPLGDLKPGDVNGDNLIDVEDLALVNYYYQATEIDGNWLEAKCVDTNGDGVINVLDVSFITERMMENLMEKIVE